MVLAGTATADPVERRMPSSYAFGAGGETIFVAHGKHDLFASPGTAAQAGISLATIVEQAL